MAMLPSEFEQFVQEELASGKYQSVEEVLCEGLRLLREKQRRTEDLRQEILPALERLDRGEGAELDVEGIKSAGMKRLAEQGGSG